MSVSEKRGRFNSSKTRVFPAFDAMLKVENGVATFLRWLSERLKPLPEFARIVSVRFDGHTDYNGETGERGFYPSFDFLLWLLNCDDATFVRMRKSASTGMPVTTKDRRDCLFSPDMVQRMEIRKEVPNSFDRKSKEWYVLEGATKPDVTIETDSFVLVIEGKRTEPHLTENTTWMKHRDQMIRHLDGVYEYINSNCSEKKVFGAYIIAEDTDPAFRVHHRPRPQYKMGKYQGGPYRRGSCASCWDDALPHRTLDERNVLKEGFLGWLTWEELGRLFDVKFPDVVDD